MMDLSFEPTEIEKIDMANRYYSRIISNFRNLQEEQPELEIKMATMIIGRFFSKRYDLITVHNLQLNELEMINKKEGFVLYKRWNESWVKYLGQHLSTIKNWKMKSNHDVRGELVNVYYLVNNHLARLGAYSDGVVNWFPEDEDAIGVLTGMMKNNSLFWE